MVKIGRFEEIQSWQKARELVKVIYEITSQGDFIRDYGLKDQLRRASVSVMSNIAEGFARQTNKEFNQYLHISLGSVAEVQSQLYIAHDLDYVSREDFARLYELSGEVARLITGFIKYLQEK